MSTMSETNDTDNPTFEKDDSLHKMKQPCLDDKSEKQKKKLSSSNNSSTTIKTSKPLRSASASAAPSTPLKSCLSVTQVMNNNPSGYMTTTTPKKNVSFHRIQIREYEQILGDHPAVSQGPPVSLGWNSQRALESTVQDYEDKRAPRRRPDEFQMPAQHRRTLVSGQHSEDEILKAQEQVEKIQRNRQSSRAMQELEGASVMMESLGRKWKRFIKRTSKQQEQDDLWIAAAAASTEKGTGVARERAPQDDDEDV